MSKRLKKITLSLLAVMIGVSCVWHYVYGAGELKYFFFDKNDALQEWKEKIFHGRVLYEIKTDGKPPEGGRQGYLSAKSDKTSSGLFYRVSFSPKKFPYISWQWKAVKFPAKAPAGSLNKKSWIERDDYCLRFYIIFPAFIFTNTKCLEYVWSEQLPKGTILTSPFYKNIKLMVLEAGSEKAGGFVTEERNILEDYKVAFGKYPASSIGAIALMTDSDNTQSIAEGYYSDIRVGYVKLLYGHLQEEKKKELRPERMWVIIEYIKRLLRWH